MLDQPPPDAPPPPPSPAALLSQQKWRDLLTIGIISILMLIGMGIFKLTREQRKMADRTEAIGNFGQMSLVLLEFESAYGSYPNDSTASEVKEATDTKLHMENRSSNDYFRQLIAAEVSQSESLFYANIPGTRKPDHDYHGVRALEKGEVGYSYIVGLSSASHPKCPLVVTPLIPGTDRFDPKPFDGYAIILSVDGSISRSGSLHPINAKGEVIDASGKHVLDPANPIWGGVKPVIKWPDL